MHVRGPAVCFPALGRITPARRSPQGVFRFLPGGDGGGGEGVALLVQKLQGELSDAMAMCGIHSLSEINRDLIFKDFSL